LAISDSAPDSPQTVALSGTGSLPLTISPATLSFGTVTVGHSSTAKTVSLTNNESTTLSFLFQRERQLLYQFERNHMRRVAGIEGEVQISLSRSLPQRTAAFNGAVTITDTAGFSPQLVGLSGTALAARLRRLPSLPPR